jgi:hypothetical protein
MATSTAQAVYELAIAGEQAGFSLEQMIQMLNAGITVEILLQLNRVASRCIRPQPTPCLPLDHVAVKYSTTDGSGR